MLQQFLLSPLPVVVSPCQDLLHAFCMASQQVCIALNLFHFPVTLCDDELDLPREPDHLALQLFPTGLFCLLLGLLDQFLVTLLLVCGYIDSAP